MSFVSKSIEKRNSANKGRLKNINHSLRMLEKSDSFQEHARLMKEKEKCKVILKKVMKNVY